jgi:hypothetical protein
MSEILHFTTLAVATIFAAAAAVAFDWLLLLAAFRLMKPATARRAPAGAQSKAGLARGTMQLARAFDSRR